MMNRFLWLPEFLSCMEDVDISFHDPSPCARERVHILEIKSEDWGKAAELSAGMHLRWAGLWAEERNETIRLSVLLVKEGDYLLLRTSVPIAEPHLDSQTPFYPGANRMERHAHDMLGVVFDDHPEPHRWTRHQAWTSLEFPLRKSFPFQPTSNEITPPDTEYPFLQAEGSGAYEIPVGPVHAGIIEPGHFRFLAVGETILNLEERLGYVHKGIEKLAEGKDAFQLARIASRVSGDSTVSHSWAACMACESAANLEVPERANFIRGILAERERIANHIGDIGAICNDVGFVFAQMQATRIKELWIRLNKEIFGHRFLMDIIQPGGVSRDLTEFQQEKILFQCEDMRREIQDLMSILTDHPSLDDRLVGTGQISMEDAEILGATGYVGRASGVDFDVRRDSPYKPYDVVRVPVPLYRNGDVSSRLQVRSDEIMASLDLIIDFLVSMPEGEVLAVFPKPAANTEGIGIVEGWRGEIVTYVCFGADGRVERFFPRDPSWFTWLALERGMRDTIVPDFPVCNKSVNASYSGHDL